MATLFAIACFVSDKPSAAHWAVSGARADIEAVARLVHAAPNARTVAEAGSDEPYFARFEFPSGAVYRDVGVERPRLGAGSCRSPLCNEKVMPADEDDTC